MVRTPTEATCEVCGKVFLHVKGHQAKPACSKRCGGIAGEWKKIERGLRPLKGECAVEDVNEKSMDGLRATASPIGAVGRNTVLPIGCWSSGAPSISRTITGSCLRLKRLRHAGYGAVQSWRSVVDTGSFTTRAKGRRSGRTTSWCPTFLRERKPARRWNTTTSVELRGACGLTT